MQAVQLSEADNGRTVQLQKGDHIVIQLPANPTTGYNWQMQPNSDFSVSQQYLAQSDAAGGAGMDVFELVSQGNGQNGSIEFQYRRSWEAAARSEKQFSISYHIQ
jgi:inhibitor of cysteine peptidase